MPASPCTPHFHIHFTHPPATTHTCPYLLRNTNQHSPSLHTYTLTCLSTLSHPTHTQILHTHHIHIYIHPTYCPYVIPLHIHAPHTHTSRMRAYTCAHSSIHSLHMYTQHAPMHFSPHPTPQMHTHPCTWGSTCIHTCTHASTHAQPHPPKSPHTSLPCICTHTHSLYSVYACPLHAPTHRTHTPIHTRSLPQCLLLCTYTPPHPRILCCAQACVRHLGCP